MNLRPLIMVSMRGSRVRMYGVILTDDRGSIHITRSIAKQEDCRVCDFFQRAHSPSRDPAQVFRLQSFDPRESLHTLGVCDRARCYDVGSNPSRAKLDRGAGRKRIDACLGYNSMCLQWHASIVQSCADENDPATSPLLQGYGFGLVVLSNADGRLLAYCSYHRIDALPLTSPDAAVWLSECGMIR
jgi:hypothetical protein